MFSTNIREFAVVIPLKEALPGLLEFFQSLDPETPTRLIITGLALKGKPRMVLNAPLEILCTAQHPILAPLQN